MSARDRTTLAVAACAASIVRTMIGLGHASDVDTHKIASLLVEIDRHGRALDRYARGSTVVWSNGIEATTREGDVAELVRRINAMARTADPQADPLVSATVNAKSPRGTVLLRVRGDGDPYWLGRVE